MYQISRVVEMERGNRIKLFKILKQTSLPILSKRTKIMFKTISNTVSELLQSKMPMAEVAISGGVGEVMAGSEGSAVMIITSIVINAVFAIIKAIEKRKAEKKAEANKNF